jgi:ABC-type transport system involved in cytochrome bd biosynthesis fused ATPase/permease subunit
MLVSKVSLLYIKFSRIWSNFSSPDTYIFDDVMSALDAKVGAFITEETILKQLKNKTVILITHGLQYLRHSDYIYVMDEGKFILQGKFEDVQKSELYLKFLELDEVSIILLFSILKLLVEQGCE